MRLKSILLVGFKSFGKKSLITFNTPITAIVGPNGSGKSNIVEAIRFVLGEQSMKSLRGKGGVDLIFKGSRLSPSSSRALVSITFDNSDKIFTFSNSGTGVSLDYNEIIISREVFADGSNKYSINQTEVRLKDIVDLLSSVNIGSSGHHIISQAEADRIISEARKQAEDLKRNTESDLQMAAQNTLNAVKQKLTDIFLDEAFNTKLQESFSDPQFLQKLILETVAAWKESEGTIIISQNMEDKLDKFFLQSLSEKASKGLKVEFSPQMKSGFALTPSDGSYKLSFTDEDFANLFKSYLRPRSNKILFKS